MNPLLVAVIIVFVLFLLGLVVSCFVIAGITDDELEDKYGIRRS